MMVSEMQRERFITEAVREDLRRNEVYLIQEQKVVEQ